MLPPEPQPALALALGLHLKDVESVYEHFSNQAPGLLCTGCTDVQHLLLPSACTQVAFASLSQHLLVLRHAHGLDVTLHYSNCFESRVSLTCVKEQSWVNGLCKRSCMSVHRYKHTWLA